MDNASKPDAVSSLPLSRTTTAHTSDRDEKTDRSHEKASDDDVVLHGGEGESAFPEDKQFEDLERLHQDWQHDPANPRNWSFSRKWTCAAVVSLRCLSVVVSITETFPGFFLHFRFPRLQLDDGTSFTSDRGPLQHLEYFAAEHDPHHFLIGICPGPIGA